VFSLLFNLRSVHADILTLQFADGNGTGSVDPHAGAFGEGWTSAWLRPQDQNNTIHTVVDTIPLMRSSEDNYMSVNMSSTSSSGRQTDYVRTYNADVATVPVTVSYLLRMDTFSGDYLRMGDRTNAALCNQWTRWGIIPPEETLLQSVSTQT
jgi:hypothetical protein